jgi:hypothetical protein
MAAIPSGFPAKGKEVRLRLIVDELPLDRVNEGLDRLRDQSVVGRILIRTSEKE